MEAFELCQLNLAQKYTKTSVYEISKRLIIKKKPYVCRNDCGS